MTSREQFDDIQSIATAEVGAKGILGYLLRKLQKAGISRINIKLANGQMITVGQPELSIGTPTLTLHRHDRTILRSGLNGLLGWAEAYMAGDWDTDDVVLLTDWGLHNEARLEQIFTGTGLTRWINYVWHLLHDNSKAGSRRNIAYHYDLGNDFYQQWLDPSMTYSAACFAPQQQPTGTLHSQHQYVELETAQQHKYQRIYDLAEIAAGDHILEIGCGWGGFAELISHQPNLQLDGYTLSKEQLAWAQERIAKRQATNRVRLHFQDYRDIKGQYDRIISIEMFEAVGERHWHDYFALLQQALKPGGTAVLQIITIDESRFAGYRQNADFIQRYIFPGGMLPTKQHIAELAADHNLQLEHRHDFGQDYARTLSQWHKNFDAAWDQIAVLGYDEHFKRMWKYYLAYCESGFKHRSIDVCHFKLRKPAN